MDQPFAIGHFVLADLSGYTGYLTQVELDHARGVLRDLLELVVAGLAPPLSLASVEGDAVFAYLPAGQLSRGETLLEIIEATYRRFRALQVSISRRTTCGCKACQRIPDLDLNFFVHSGEFRLQHVSGRPEPLGLAADLVRSRALKPSSSSGGARGYAIVTAESLQQLGLAPEALGWQPETLPAGDVGAVEAYRLDLRSRYEFAESAHRDRVTAIAADSVVVWDLPASLAVVWEWLNEPIRRSRWMAGRRWHAGERPAGRTGPGARNHCDHGLGAVIETVLDWQPFETFTVALMPRGGGPVVHQTYELEALAEGRQTRVHCYVKFQRSLPRWLARPLGLLSGRAVLRPDLRRLERLLADEAVALP